MPSYLLFPVYLADTLSSCYLAGIDIPVSGQPGHLDLKSQTKPYHTWKYMHMPDQVLYIKSQSNRID